MRVVHLDTGRDWRGGQRQVLLLARGLAERGVDSTIAAPASSHLAERARAAGFPVVPFDPLGDLDLPTAWSLARQAFRSKPDDLLAHAHDARSHAVAAIAKGSISPGGLPPLVVTRRVIPKRRGFWSRVKHRLGVDRTIAISEAVRRALLELEVPEERIRVVHSGIEPVGAVEAVDWRRRLGLHSGVRLVGSVGALSGEKGYEDLVEALPRLPPDVHFVLVGDGPKEEPLRRRAVELGARGRLHLPGRTDRPRDAMAGFELYVQPSRREGLGTAVLDAMALGLPVVTTDAGGLPEVVEDGRSGLQVAVGDAAALAAALARLLDDHGLRARLAENAFRVAERFSAERMVEGTLAVYRELIP